MFKKWLMLFVMVSLGLLYLFGFLAGGLVKLTWGDTTLFVGLEFIALVLLASQLALVWFVYKAGRARQWWSMRANRSYDKNLTLATLLSALPTEYQFLLGSSFSGSLQPLIKHVLNRDYQDVLRVVESKHAKPEEKIALNLLKAFAAQRLNNHKLRLEFLIKAVNLNKADALVLRLLWLCLCEMNACDQALSILFRIRKTRFFARPLCDQWEAETLVKRANLSDDHYRAFIDYQKASVLDPYLVSARLGVFDTLKNMNKYKQALQNIEAAWFYIQHHELARRYLEDVPLQELVTAAKRLASFAPESVESVHVVVEALLQTSDFYDGEGLIEQLPKENWTAKTYFLAAELYAKLGQKDKVSQLCKTAQLASVRF